MKTISMAAPPEGWPQPYLATDGDDGRDQLQAFFDRVRDEDVPEVLCDGSHSVPVAYPVDRGPRELAAVHVHGLSNVTFRGTLRAHRVAQDLTGLTQDPKGVDYAVFAFGPKRFVGDVGVQADQALENVSFEHIDIDGGLDRVVGDSEQSHGIDVYCCNSVQIGLVTGRDIRADLVRVMGSRSAVLDAGGRKAGERGIWCSGVVIGAMDLDRSRRSCLGIQGAVRRLKVGSIRSHNVSDGDVDLEHTGNRLGIEDIEIGPILATGDAVKPSSIQFSGGRSDDWALAKRVKMGPIALQTGGLNLRRCKQVEVKGVINAGDGDSKESKIGVLVNGYVDDVVVDVVARNRSIPAWVRQHGTSRPASITLRGEYDAGPGRFAVTITDCDGVVVEGKLRAGEAGVKLEAPTGPVARHRIVPQVCDAPALAFLAAVHDIEAEVTDVGDCIIHNDTGTITLTPAEPVDALAATETWWAEARVRDRLSALELALTSAAGRAWGELTELERGLAVEAWRHRR